MLTEIEMDVVQDLGRIYARLEADVVGHGECREDDLAELRGLTHRLQYSVMAQSAARQHPGRLRLLGLSVEESAQPR